MIHFRFIMNTLLSYYPPESKGDVKKLCSIFQLKIKN